jgi:hypothetical protein
MELIPSQIAVKYFFLSPWYQPAVLAQTYHFAGTCGSPTALNILPVKRIRASGPVLLSPVENLLIFRLIIFSEF